MDPLGGPFRSESPLAWRAVAGATAALLLLGVIGVVTVDDDTDTVDAVAGTTTTLVGDAPIDPGLGSPVTGAPVPPGGDPAAPPATAAPGPAPAPGAGATPPATSQPGPLTPPKTGLYRYKLVEDGEEKRSELRITADGGSASEPQFKYRETADGNSTESVTAWRSNGVFEASRDFPSSQGQSSRCDWEPDVLLAPKPLGANSAWSWDSRCRAAVEGQEADFHYTGNSKVVGTARASAGGQGVDTWRVETKGRIEITGNAGGRPFVVVIDISSVDLLSSDRGVIVRSETETKITPPGGGTQTSNAVRELQNLDPA